MSARPLLDQNELLAVPTFAATLDGFRSWVMADDFPKQGRISFVNQEILIDMSPEELETHNKVKLEVSTVLATICRDEDLGTFYADRTLLSHPAADLATEPDALFVSWEGFRSERIRPVPLYWVYVTAWATPDGVVQFRDDIYNRDGLGPTASSSRG